MFLCRCTWKKIESSIPGIKSNALNSMTVLCEQSSAYCSYPSFDQKELMYHFSIHCPLRSMVALWFDIYFIVWPQNDNADVFYNGLLLWFKTPKKHITLICTPMVWNWQEKSYLTKENICIKWKADEKICNYVPDWVKYFSASTCQLPLEPFPNGLLPGLGEAPENITSEWCHLAVSSDPWPVCLPIPLSSLLRSAPLCVPDNGAQLLSAKGSVAARE